MIQFSHQFAYAAFDGDFVVMLPHQSLFDLPGQLDASCTVAGVDSGFEFGNESSE